MGKLERLTTGSKGYLHINEQIHCVIMGAFEIVSQGSSIYRVRSGIVLATNQRVVFFDSGFFHIVKEWPIGIFPFSRQGKH